MNYLDILESQLIIDEGKRDKMYLDSIGIPTIGIGHNLRDRAISDRAIRVIFEDDMAVAEADARVLVKNFDALTDGRKAVVVNMSFQLGLNRLSSFKNTLSAITGGRWDEAALRMMESKVAKVQTPARWDRLSEAMRKG